MPQFFCILKYIIRLISTKNLNGTNKNDMKKTYYQILELNQAKAITEEEIKKAYRRLSKKYHPDANPGNREAEERFREISEAYAVLGDKEKRKQYDNRLKQVVKGQGAGQGKEQQPRRSPGNDFFGGSSMSANFERFFGFRPQTGNGGREQTGHGGGKKINPLDTTDLFEKYMGIKK